MPRSLRRPLSVACALLVALVAVAAALLQLGHYSMVVTHGVSMNPTYHQGDLVVVKRESSYAIGQAVAYRQPGKDLVVLHRIIGGDAAGFTFQGDNNQSIDPATPSQDQLLGRAVLHVPGGGLWFSRATDPYALAALAFLLVLSGGTAAHTRRSRRKKQRMTRHSNPSASLTQLPPALHPIGAISALAVLVGLTLAAVGWSGPATVSSTVRGAGSTVTFSYAADVPRTVAYDGDVVRSPDPVFRRLARTVDVRVGYSGVPGTAALHAEVSTASGWRTQVALTSEVALSGSADSVTATLDLPGLQARAAAAAAVTGLPAGQLDVAVVSVIRPTSGPVFIPRLELVLTPLRLSLASGSDLVATNPTTPTRVLSAPRDVSLLGQAVPVTVVRAVSGLLLVLGAVGGLATLLLARRGAAVSEAARIQQRHASVLLAVQPMTATEGRPVVDVTGFEALVKLAERYGLLILHWSRSGVDTYLVQDDSTTYRYRTTSVPAEEPTPDTEPQRSWAG